MCSLAIVLHVLHAGNAGLEMVIDSVLYNSLLQCLRVLVYRTKVRVVNFNSKDLGPNPSLISLVFSLNEHVLNK